MNMKRYLSWTLILALLLSCLCANALALGYHPIQNEESTFETLEEARVNGPVAMKELPGNETRNYISHPALDSISEGTVYVYRSAHLFGTRAAARLNNAFLVYTDESFETKDDAFAYLEEMGLISIIDTAIGSIVLVTPAVTVDSSGNVSQGYTSADQKNYYALQTAMLSQGGTVTTETGMAYTAEGEYFGTYGNLYVIGIGDGATFLNNYVASTFDFASRIAGMLLIGGGMELIRPISTFIPVYLVDPLPAVADKYKAANGVDSSTLTHAKDIYYNKAFPLRKVIIAQGGQAIGNYVRDAYYSMFVKAMRLPVLLGGIYSGGTPYQGYNYDQAPYSLCEQNAVLGEKTADGIYRIEHQEDRFSAIQTESGEYLETWYEYLPEEVLENTAPEHSIPLILGNHGVQDDPRLFVEQMGYLTLIGKERIAMVAPEHQYIAAVRAEAFKALIDYMLETYPALDPSRVYVTGYSMGAAATFTVSAAHPELFAATVPMCMSSSALTEEQLAVFETLDLPMLFSTSTYGGDLTNLFDPTNQVIGSASIDILNLYLRLNEMDVQIGERDYDAYPMAGFDCDSVNTELLNGEFLNHIWMFEKDGVPMVGISVTEGPVHALYPEYSKLMWDFAKHFSRNLETMETIYNPYVD